MLLQAFMTYFVINALTYNSSCEIIRTFYKAGHGLLQNRWIFYYQEMRINTFTERAGISYKVGEGKSGCRSN